MPTPEKFTIALVQMSCSTDPAANLRKAVAKVEEAAGRGAQVVCLPELFRSQYFCQREDAALFDLAEPIPGPSTDALAAVAKKLKIAVIAPVFERRAAGLYHNSVAILDANGELRGIYRKMHIPDDPAYYEKFYFTPGDLGFRAFDTHAGRIGTLICWDQWYPEGARLTALQGAAVIFYPTAIGWHPSEKEEHGAAQHDAFAMKLDLPDISVGARIMRVEADRQRKRVEPQGAARPGGIDPACCCLTPHGFSLPARIMFPVDARDLSAPPSELT